MKMISERVREIQQRNQREQTAAFQKLEATQAKMDAAFKPVLDAFNELADKLTIYSLGTDVDGKEAFYLYRDLFTISRFRLEAKDTGLPFMAKVEQAPNFPDGVSLFSAWPGNGDGRRQNSRLHSDVVVAHTAEVVVEQLLEHAAISLKPLP